jgi:hypothetical protein
LQTNDLGVELGWNSDLSPDELIGRRLRRQIGFPRTVIVPTEYGPNV